MAVAVVPPVPVPPGGGVVGLPVLSTGSTTLSPSNVIPADRGLGSAGPLAAAMMHVTAPLSACACDGGQLESGLAPSWPVLTVNAVGVIEPSALIGGVMRPPRLQPLPS